jgi:hypothetical protein
MLNQTRRALEDFDNQHDFERMAADILTALGYSNVEPVAPGGGADGGQDIRFMESDTPGIAFVTLNKNIKDKFQTDLEKQDTREGVIALFCNVNISPSLKLTFTKDAVANGYRLEVFDLERLRSLLDTSLKDIRKRYLHIDDEVAARLRSEVNKLMRYPDSEINLSDPPSIIERMLVNKLPCKMFELLMQYEEKDVLDIPEIGSLLHNHFTTYYQFRKEALSLQESLISHIGQMVKVRFREAWQIYYKYAIMRFGGMSKEEIIAEGDFLNYGITWDDAERIYSLLSNEEVVSTKVANLFLLHDKLNKSLNDLIAQ